MTEPAWQKSRRCESNACVEVAEAGDRVLVRSSVDPGIVVQADKDMWRDFIEAAPEWFKD